MEAAGPERPAILACFFVSAVEAADIASNKGANRI